ncbi:MAG: 30S ribosomal protein S19e [Candidatus Micrarchaeota archaeon]|nr:30S ribosomal protein S19e [Candidatus Micrarchaeota archaeon]MDE1849308.1 30S ribosomal protein S19e [Candidatus Micrarchaeota archaeon]
MANILEVDTQKLVESAAQKLKQSGGMDKPKYVDFVKSGASRERPPSDPDFWYMRCASVLRQVYLEGPIGVSKLRTRYGSRVNHTVHRHHHFRSGGSLIKDAFDALEKKGYVKKGKKGRIITPVGRSFLDKVAGELSKGA